MPSTRELRRRIKSVKNISQITKAMQMVAATKMRKAQAQALTGRPYSQNLKIALTRLLPKVNPEANPLVNARESGKIGVIVLTTDKALCGSLNTNVFKAVQSFAFGSYKEIAASSATPRKDVIASTAKQSDLVFYTLGKKGRNFLARTNREVAADFENSDIISFRTASQIAKLVTDEFLNGGLKEVYLIYPDFISALRQEPKITKLLPIDFASVLSELEASGVLGNSGEKKAKEAQNKSSEGEFLIEPDPGQLLDFVLRHHLEMKVYQAILETKASEHSARMIAMQNATDNAKELVEDLNLQYNQTRQDNITRELLEITTAGAAMN